MTSAPTTAEPARPAFKSHARRALAACCGAHFLHDGATDLIYVLLPVWQAQLGLSLAETGLLRSVYMACLAGFQVPAGLVAERIGARRTLAIGTGLVGLGFLLAGWSGGFLALAACLALGGLGASVQHPIGSSLTASSFEGRNLRAALSTYNLAGDLGKMALPALAALLIAAWQWRWACGAIGLGLLASALGILWAVGSDIRSERRAANENATPPLRLPPAMAKRGFVSLSAIAAFDSASRAGFLVLLPFLLGAKGASLPTVGLGLSLVFAGGAAGKFVCGLMARRVGILRTVILTECATAIAMIAVVPLPLDACLALLPPLGLALNGTSSVLYGTVAELVPAERRARAFGIFYTVGLSASALTPTVFGALSDNFGMSIAIAAAALAALLVVPLTLPLRQPIALLSATSD